MGQGSDELHHPAAAVVVHGGGHANLSGAANDARLIELWLHGKSAHTQRAYRSDLQHFMDHVGGRALATVTLADVQGFAARLAAAPDSNARRLSGVKSLFAFAHRVGFLQFDVARPVKTPARKSTLAERILPEAEVHKMIALEPSPRNAALLRLLYGGGLRVSEAAALTWRDLQQRDEGGQVTVFGKGGKTRAVRLPQALWDALCALRGAASGDDPVFRSRKGGRLDPSAVLRIVRVAARRAGIAENVSPHWLRHAHASHALDRGAPIHLVQVTLGHASVATTGRYLHARPADSSSRFLAV
jgi:integrase/recombinase XerD